GGRRTRLLSPWRGRGRAEGGGGAFESLQRRGGARVLPRHDGRQRRALGGGAAGAADAGGDDRADRGDGHRVDAGDRRPPPAAGGGDRGGAQRRGGARSRARVARFGRVARKPDPDLGAGVRHPDARAAGSALAARAPVRRRADRLRRRARTLSQPTALAARPRPRRAAAGRSRGRPRGVPAAGGDLEPRRRALARSRGGEVVRAVTRRAAVAALAAGAGSALWARRARAARAKLAPVLVSRDRILRTIVGLRPFRPSGFVVRADKLGDKLIVHNYGHGGCGVTLSWGTGALAVDEVLRAGDKRVAVLGCGVVGLATARLLQQRGIAATIYARDQPPATTSDIAGGRWYPFDVFDRAVVTPRFLETLWRAARVSYEAFAKLPAAAYGIHRYRTYACRNTPFPPESLLNFNSPVHDLLPGLRDLPPDEKPFPYPI